MAEQPVAIDLFAGAGGMSLGLEAAGFNVAVAVEIDPIHALVHHVNFPHCHTICRDIAQVDSQSLLTLLGRRNYQEVDLIAGGPPCQGFSLMGKRQWDDPRNSLVFEYVRLIRDLQPKYFLFENVPGLATKPYRPLLEDLINQLESLGYRLAQPVHILDASAYGAPQKRRRLILIGSRWDQNPASYPLCRSPLMTVAEAIGDLANIPALTKAELDRGIAPGKLDYGQQRQKYAPRPQGEFHLCQQRRMGKRVYNHLASVHTEATIARFAATPVGTIEPKSRFLKLDPQGFCNTLRAGTDSERGAHTAPRPIHYALPRCITVREAARLHTFPDWFQFHRTIWHGFREIGNAVVPLLAKELGQSIITALAVENTELTPAVLGRPSPRLLTYNVSQAQAYWRRKHPRPPVCPPVPMAEPLPLEV